MKKKSVCVCLSVRVQKRPPSASPAQSCPGRVDRQPWGRGNGGGVTEIPEKPPSPPSPLLQNPGQPPGRLRRRRYTALGRRATPGLRRVPTSPAHLLLLPSTPSALAATPQLLAGWHPGVSAHGRHADPARGSGDRGRAEIALSPRCLKSCGC